MPIPRLFLLTALFSGAFLSQSCATFRSAEPEPGVTLRPGGTVIKVDPYQHFVIFESSFRFRPDQQVFAVRDGQRMARLIVHSQSRPPFYAADILEGRPEIDDLIE